MADESEEIVLELTPEQQAVVRRLSGQKAQILQLSLSADGTLEGVGRGLNFRWRLSQATGIPRQVWGSEKAQSGSE